jgi:hypothetical protein
MHKFYWARKPDPAPVAQTGVQSRCFWERVNGKISKAKTDESISEKKYDTAIAKAEKWVKPSQKLKYHHQDLFNEGHNSKRNTKMNVKKSADGNRNIKTMNGALKLDSRWRQLLIEYMTLHRPIGGE